MPSLLPKLRESAVSPVRDTRKIRQSGSSIHHLSFTSRFRMIDGDSCTACPLAFGSSSLPLPSSNARHPASAPARPVAPATAPARCARPRPPFGASKLHSLKYLQSHELKLVDEYCTTPFCNGAFRGEIRYTGAPSRVTYGTLAYLNEARLIPLRVAVSRLFHLSGFHTYCR